MSSYPYRWTIFRRLSIALFIGGLTVSGLLSAPTTSTSLSLATLATSVSSQTPSSDHRRIVATIQVSGPSEMVVEGDSVWVVAGDSLVQIDARTNEIVGKPIRTDPPFDSAVAFSEGALWVTRVEAGDLGAASDHDAVLHIDPHNGEVVATLKVARGPMSLAITPGAVWVVNFGHNGESVSRIDPRTNQIVGKPIVTGRAPISLAVGDGSLWAANHDAHTVTRIDPQTNQIVANIHLSTEPHRIAFGEGMVWVGNWHDNSVTRIDPKTNQVVGDPIPIGFRAGNIAVGHGSVWITSDYRSNGDAKDVVLVRIDPQTNQVADTIPIGGHPIDVAMSKDAVWVSIQSPDAVLRITP
jgi:YVTN family beta-propeller protein